MNKPIIVLANGELGYIKDICTCSQCVERGNLEFIVVDYKNRFLENLTIDDLQSEQVEHYDPYALCELLYNKIFEIRRKEDD